MSVAMPLPRAAPGVPAVPVSLAIGCGLMLAALAIRAPHFGHPAYQVDEEFYLLVGDRLLHGALPYVDIWDRKPIGLFLLFAAIRLIGGIGIVQYQVVATLFAGGTAWLIAHLARSVTSTLGAVAAGLAYLLWIETVEGGGGQSPIFYNLFVAGAAASTLAALARPDRAGLLARGLAAMALAGLAIQIKYTAVFECGWFGLLLAWEAGRRTGTVAGVLGPAAALAATALAPTLAAMLVYAGLGHFQAFWFANFVSIFGRGAADPTELHGRIHQIVLHVAPFAACMAVAAWELRRPATTQERRWRLLMAGWVIAGFVGFLSVGQLFFHYLLPLMVPMAVAAAPAFRRGAVGATLAGALLWLPLANLAYPDIGTTRYFQQRIGALQALIPPQVDRGCMELLGGPPILYHLTGACFATPYIFPGHLISRTEAGAIGVDPKAELARMLARRPLVLVIDDHFPHLDPARFAMIRSARALHYRRAGQVLLDGRWIAVWLRRS